MDGLTENLYQYKDLQEITNFQALVSSAASGMHIFTFHVYSCSPL